MVDNTMTQFGKGEKKIGIFGFCDIRNFTDATEVLFNVIGFIRKCHVICKYNSISGSCLN